MADCGHPLHRTRGPACECGSWTVADGKRDEEPLPEDCQVPEVRYVQSSDQAVSGDKTS